MTSSKREAEWLEPGAVKRVVLSIRRGSLSGLFTSWILLKVMIPTMVVVQLLKVTGLLDAMADLGAPLMGMFGLPGETGQTRQLHRRHQEGGRLGGREIIHNG